LYWKGAIAGGALIGHDGHRGATYYVSVDPNLQRIRAGRVLMAAVEDWLRARGIWKLNLLVRRETREWSAFTRSSGTGTRIVLHLESDWMAKQIEVRVAERSSESVADFAGCATSDRTSTLPVAVAEDRQLNIQHPSIAPPRVTAAFVKGF
jgi:GNAT superfamily N-acetyltransferase